MSTALALPPILDYAGVAVFALTGALAAARDRHDIITFWFFAVVTGVGGGTLRDLLIGAPVFWIGDAAYLWIGAAASLLECPRCSILVRAASPSRSAGCRRPSIPSRRSRYRSRSPVSALAKERRVMSIPNCRAGSGGNGQFGAALNGRLKRFGGSCR